jgi:hypothetical protein
MERLPNGLVYNVMSNPKIPRHSTATIPSDGGNGTFDPSTIWSIKDSGGGFIADANTTNGWNVVDAGHDGSLPHVVLFFKVTCPASATVQAGNVISWVSTGTATTGHCVFDVGPARRGSSSSVF